jgi:hypothetical protein
LSPCRVKNILHVVQTGSGTHQAFYPMDTEGLPPPEVKLPRREADRSPSSNAEVKDGGDIPPLPVRLHGMVLN